jgi:hypothetical protein
MAQSLTPSQRLAEIALGRPLAEYVAEKRNARPRWPWRLIAEQLAADTGGEINVTHETLRGWYADEVAA